MVVPCLEVVDDIFSGAWHQNTRHLGLYGDHLQHHQNHVAFRPSISLGNELATVKKYCFCIYSLQSCQQMVCLHLQFPLF